MTKWIALLMVLGGLGMASRFAKLDTIVLALVGLALAVVGLSILLALGFELL